MQAPTATELRDHPLVQQALEQAWIDSLPDDARRRDEEGGWIYCEVAAGGILVRRAPSGGQALLDLSAPGEIPGFLVVPTFHTHPNPSNEGWVFSPSEDDIRSAFLFGVPCLIRADDGIYTTGPESRRGGLTGESGFPHQTGPTP